MDDIIITGNDNSPIKHISHLGLRTFCDLKSFVVKEYSSLNINILVTKWVPYVFLCIICNIQE